jgi:hypothetical protein
LFAFTALLHPAAGEVGDELIDAFGCDLDQGVELPGRGKWAALGGSLVARMSTKTDNPCGRGFQRRASRYGWPTATHGQWL